MKKSILILLVFTNHLMSQGTIVVETINPNYAQMTDLSNVFVDPNMNNWKSVQNGQIPGDALVAGHEQSGTKFYIARVNYKNGQLIGKVRQGDRSAMFALGNKEVYFENYSVYVGKGKWITAIDRNSYNFVIPLGRDTTGRPIFSSRSWHIQPGSLQNGSVDWDKNVNIPYGGISKQPRDFEILVRQENIDKNQSTYGIALNLKSVNYFSLNPETGMSFGIDQTKPWWHMESNEAWATTIISGNKNYLETRLFKTIIGRSRTNAICVSVTNLNQLVIQNYSEDENNNTINPNCQWEIEHQGMALRFKNIFLDKYLYTHENKILLGNSKDNDKCDFKYWWIIESSHSAARDRE